MSKSRFLGACLATEKNERASDLIDVVNLLKDNNIIKQVMGEEAMNKICSLANQLKQKDKQYGKQIQANNKKISKNNEKILGNRAQISLNKKQNLQNNNERLKSENESLENENESLENENESLTNEINISKQYSLNLLETLALLGLIQQKTLSIHQPFETNEFSTINNNTLGEIYPESALRSLLDHNSCLEKIYLRTMMSQSHISTSSQQTLKDQVTQAEQAEKDYLENTNSLRSQNARSQAHSSREEDEVFLRRTEEQGKRILTEITQPKKLMLHAKNIEYLVTTQVCLFLLTQTEKNKKKEEEEKSKSNSVNNQKKYTYMPLLYKTLVEKIFEQEALENPVLNDYKNEMVDFVVDFLINTTTGESVTYKGGELQSKLKNIPESAWNSFWRAVTTLFGLLGSYSDEDKQALNSSIKKITGTLNATLSQETKQQSVSESESTSVSESESTSVSESESTSVLELESASDPELEPTSDSPSVITDNL